MMTMFQVGVEQEIPNLAKRNARTGIAEAEVNYARAQLTQAQYAAAIGAGQAWIALAFAQRRLTLADAALEELRELVPVARSAVASGSARPAQSLEIRRALLDLEDARTAIEAEHEAAQARLARYIFIESPVAAGTVPAPDIDPEQLRSALERNPEILLAGAAVNRAEATTRLAESERRPDFGVSVNYGVRDRDYGDMFSVMGSVTLPIFAGRRQEPRIRAAEAEASAARAEREDQRRALEAQFEGDVAMWRSAYRQWQRGRDELLPLARDRADLETASFAANRAGLTDVVEAKKELALIGLEVLEREQAAAEAATRLRLTYREHMSW
jgi:outer membrane protein TolC